MVSYRKTYRRGRGQRRGRGRGRTQRRGRGQRGGVYLTGNPQITFVDSSGGKKRRSMRGGAGGLMQLVEQEFN